jgi:hypothetical protein
MYGADNRGAIPPLVCHRAGFPHIGYQIMNNSAYGVRLSGASGPDYNAGWPDLLQIYLDPKNQRDNTPVFKKYSDTLYCANDFASMTPGHPSIGWWPASSEGFTYDREISWKANPNITPIRVTGLPSPMEGAPVYGAKFGGVRSPGQKILYVEHHYTYVAGAAWGQMQANMASAFGGAPILSDKPEVRWGPTGHVSPPRHRRGFVAAYCDGSARTLNWAERAELMLMKARDWDLQQP